MSIWNTLLYQPLVNLILVVYQFVVPNLGMAIILSTVLIRSALIPLTLPGMKSSQKMQQVKPELDKLKEKHKDDKQGLAQAQLELYKKHKINPLGGIIPMIVQLVILIALFQAFRNVLVDGDGVVKQLNQVLYSFAQLPADTILNTKFLYLDVTQPDTIKLPFTINLLIFELKALPGLFLMAAAATQFFSSKLMISWQGGDKAKKGGKQSNPEDMAMSMQKQMIFLMPVMTIVIGMSFPSGLVLYWLTFSLIMLIQQRFLKKKVKSNKS